MCISIFCEPCSDVMNFEVNLTFLIKSFLLHDHKLITQGYVFWKVGFQV